jgi:hypothetical protein
VYKNISFINDIEKSMANLFEIEGYGSRSNFSPSYSSLFYKLILFKYINGLLSESVVDRMSLDYNNGH